MNPRHTKSAAPFLLGLVLFVVPAFAAPAPEVAARKALHDAVLAGKTEDLIRARAAFEALSMAEPGSALFHYWIAVADWRLIPRLGDDRAAGERYCKDGIAHADRAIEADPKLAEALALKASLQGMSLTYHPDQMMSLGAEMEASFARARTMAPGNPRVLLLEAINTLHKPEFVGGGPGKALPQFLKAQEAFAAEKPAGGAAPAWGRDDAYIWAGVAEMRRGNPDAAVGFYHKALEATPGHPWVKGALLPEAEKAAAAKAAEPKAGADTTGSGDS